MVISDTHVGFLGSNNTVCGELNWTGMELFTRRSYNCGSWLWLDQQHSPWHWHPRYPSSLPSNPSL